MGPLRGLSLLGEPTPVGPAEHPSSLLENQGKGSSPQRKPRARRPRSRICLLKGCGRVFRPIHPLARYCSDCCREAARKWRQWEARHRYRRTARGKQIRRAQSRRYRQRRKRRDKGKTGIIDGARVITRKFFFVHLRSPWMLRRIRAQPALAVAEILFPCVSPGSATGPGAREALAGTLACPAMTLSAYRPAILHPATRTQ
jgi:hypothetical protein